MTHKCNGCGGEFDALAGVLAYGDVQPPRQPDYAQHVGDGVLDIVQAEHFKTLCPRCQHVLKDILLRSDLSEHWHKYEWSLMGGPYTEGYDD